jgi:outer membrane receptor protein involved in Fe transport
VDAGITSQTKTVKYGVRGFYSTIRDYITPVPVCIDPTPPDFIAAPKVMGRDFQYFPPQWRTDLGTSNENADTNQAGYIYANVDCAVLFGGDLFGEVQLSDWLTVFGNMSYVRGVNCNPVVYVDDGSWVVTQGQFVPIGHSEGLLGIYPYSGTVGVRMSEPETDLWGLELSARMVRRQDYVAVSLSELPTAGFATFALQAYYRLRPQIRLTLSIDNLFNRDYTEHGSLVIIGRDGNPTFVKEPGTTAVIGMDARF